MCVCIHTYYLYAYPFYLFCLTFLSLIRTWLAQVREDGDNISSPYLLPLHLHQHSLRTMHLIGVGGANTFSFIPKKKENLQIKKKFHTLYKNTKKL